MPRLNLLAKEKLDFCGVLFGDLRQYRIIEGLEHFCGEWTDIVKVELDLLSFQCQQHFPQKVAKLQDSLLKRKVKCILKTCLAKAHYLTARSLLGRTYCVNSFRRDTGGVSLPSEFRSECHLDEGLPELKLVVE